MKTGGSESSKQGRRETKICLGAEVDICSDSHGSVFKQSSVQAGEMHRGLANLQRSTLNIFENFHPVLSNTNTHMKLTALQSQPPTYRTQFAQKGMGR